MGTLEYLEVNKFFSPDVSFLVFTLFNFSWKVLFRRMTLVLHVAIMNNIQEIIAVSWLLPEIKEMMYRAMSFSDVVTGAG